LFSALLIHSFSPPICLVGNYADAQQSMSRLDDVKEESDSKSHQSYGVLNKSWGDSGDKKSSAASKTALVVDDGAMCRKACGAMMIEMGFKVEYANDGKEAVDKIFREDPVTGVIAVNYYELVMMDNFMPNMDGSDAVTLLRLNGYTGTIIGLTYDIFDEPSKLFRWVCGCCHPFSAILLIEFS
jgi:CheY-like chemotaxis protein